MDLEEYVNKRTRLPVQALLYAFALSIFIIPSALAGAPLLLLPPPWSYWTMIVIGPPILLLAVVSVAGLLAMPFRRAIVPVKAPRRLDHFVYGPRRLYGLCWNFIYYSGPLYQAFLALPALRGLMLRLFGYRGSLAVAIAPDAWIRDLPVLSFGKGVYLANKCTVGSNICLANGWIYVDTISLADEVMIGHGAVLGPGATMGEGSEVGVNGMFGIRSKTGTKVSIGIRATVSHRVEIGDGAEIANAALLGLKCKVGPGVKIPFGAVIPEAADVASQRDVERYFNAETKVLRADHEALVDELASKLGRTDELAS